MQTRCAILHGNRAAYAAPELTFRNSIDLLRRMENTSINVELQKTGIDPRVSPDPSE